MEGYKKILLFVCTTLVALVTAWWIIPTYLNVWTETATLNSVYGIGLFLGIVLGVCWSVIIWYWLQKD